MRPARLSSVVFSEKKTEVSASVCFILVLYRLRAKELVLERNLSVIIYCFRSALLFFSLDGLLLENELVTISAIPSHFVSSTAFSSAQSKLMSGLTELAMTYEHFFSVFSSAENIL